MIGTQKYIGKITLVNLRNYIIDNVTEDQTIWLHRHDYDLFASEYIKHYNDGIPEPFAYMGIQIESDTTRTVTEGRIFVGIEGELYPDATIGKSLKWKAK